MSYTDLFERFFDKDENQIRGLVSYGLYKVAKREWVGEFRSRNGKSPDAAEIDAYTATWTTSMVDGKRSEADLILEDFTAAVVDGARPEILKEALRGQTLKSIGINIFSGFLYTLILIGIVVVLKKAGVDLLSLAQA